MSNEPNNKPQVINAIEAMRDTVAVAERVRDGAGMYLEAMTSSIRPEVIVGDFYSTFGGSTALVLRRQTKCQCPRCTGQLIQFSPIAFLFGRSPEETYPPEQPHAEPVEEPEHYLVMVVRGGHGVKDLRGQKPGENYLIGADGLVIFTNPAATEEPRCASASSLAMAGLSLKTRLNVVMTPVDAEVSA